MAVSIQNLKEEKDKIAADIVEKDKKFVKLSLDLVLDHLAQKKEGCPASEGGWICPEMIKDSGPMVKAKVPLVLDTSYQKGFLDREIKSGIIHYKLK